MACETEYLRCPTFKEPKFWWLSKGLWSWARVGLTVGCRLSRRLQRGCIMQWWAQQRPGLPQLLLRGVHQQSLHFTTSGKVKLDLQDHTETQHWVALNELCLEQELQLLYSQECTGTWGESSPVDSSFWWELPEQTIALLTANEHYVLI